MLFDLFVVVAATLVFVAAATVCELVAPYDRRRTVRLSGLGIALFSVICIAVVTPPFEGRTSLSTIIAVPALGLLGIPFALLVSDFAGYWLHRAQHRWFWRFHAVHHAPREMHAHVGALGHPVEAIARVLILTAPLSLIDMSLIAFPATWSLVRRFFEFYIHTETSADLGPLRRVLVDNRFHRLHHGRDEVYRDCNFGILFSFWDGLFGTARWPRKDEWPEVGVDDYLPARTVTQFLLHPWSGRQDR